eukprot:4249716-Amphidinium_carterae.1
MLSGRSTVLAAKPHHAVVHILMQCRSRLGLLDPESNFEAELWHGSELVPEHHGPDDHRLMRVADFPGIQPPSQ